MIRNSTRLALKVATPLAALSLFASACGTAADGAADGANDSGTGKVERIAKMVPPEVAKRGTLSVATFVYPPSVIQAPGGDLSGWEISTLQAVGDVMGLKTEFHVMTLDALIPALAAKRFDVGAGELGIIPDRTNVVNIVQDHAESQSFLVHPDNAGWKPGPLGVCGKTVATTTGSSFVGDIQEWSKKCKDSGKPALQMKAFQDQATVNLAVENKRVDFSTSTTSQAVYVVKQSEGKIARVPATWAPALGTGIAVPKTAYQAQMSKAIEAAVNELIKTGKLKQILDKYNDGQGMISKSEVFCCGQTKTY